MLQFSDGWKVDTSGRFRVITGPDGKYVVGHGMLIPVGSEKEGHEMIRVMQDREEALAVQNVKAKRVVGNKGE